MTQFLRRFRTMDVLLVGVLVIWTTLGRFLAPFDPYSASVSDRLQPPAWPHVMGTDDNGFDILSRILAAGQIDVGIALTATIIAAVAGSILGLLVTQLERSFDRVLRMFGASVLRLTEIMQAFPVFIFAMILVASFGANALNLIIAIAFVNAPVFLRLVRAEAQTLWSLQFSEAAQLMGNSNGRISFLHILPNAFGTIMNQVSVTIGFGVLLTAGLSFVGAGIKPPTPELGGMIAAGGRYVISGQWWVAVFPGLALAFLIFSFAYLGDRISAAVLARGSVRRAAAPAIAGSIGETLIRFRPMVQTHASGHAVMEIADLSVFVPNGGSKLVSDFNLTLDKGSAVAIVGASGAGKSLLIRALLGVFDEAKLTVTGHMRVDGGDETDLSEADASTRFHLGVCGLVANPRLMLNPVIKLDTYFNRVLAARGVASRRERVAEACRLLTAVGISDAETRLSQYPFELSGGTAQRVCIALSLAAGAKVLCFDEPTAGLDVTIQRQVLDVINELRRDLGIAVIFSTSDLALATHFSDRIVVLDRGAVVEEQESRTLYAHPQSQAAKAIVEVSRA